MCGRQLKKIITLIAAAAVMLIPQPARAETSTLSELCGLFAAYQDSPAERAEEIKKELAKVQDVENGFARQYGVNVSEVLAYEFELENLINVYNSLYFIQNAGEVKNTFLIDDSRISYISSISPPYQFIFFLDVNEDVNNFHKELALLRKDISFSRDRMQDLREKRTALEKDYRLCLEKSSASSSDRLKYNFQLNVQKARLETCMAQYTFYEHSLGLALEQAVKIEEKLDALTPIVKKIRENISDDDSDFDILDSAAFSNITSLRNTINMLNARFKEIDALRLSADMQTPFSKYWLSTERRLVQDEGIFALDMCKLWSAVRLAWRSNYELLTGRLTLQQEKETVARMKELIAYAESHLSAANENLQMIRTAEQETARRLGSEQKQSYPGEAEARDAFTKRLSEQKRRYLNYIVAIGAISDQFETLASETERALGASGSEEKIRHFWTKNLTAVMDTEVWSAGDYPITVKKIFMALLIFISCMVATRYCIRIAVRHFERSQTFSRHGSMLMQNAIFYCGLIISFLATLWTLHIPLTAFAFMGGAAAIAIGLGTQKIMGDALSGILLLFQKKLRIGDEVVIGDTHGIVREITLQNTVLMCQQSRHLIIPNSKVLDSAILNLTLNNSLSRTEVCVSIAYDSDVEKAMGLIRTILSENQNVLKTPPYRIILSAFEESAVKLTVYFFIDLSREFESNVQSAVRISILEAFKENGIDIPFPQAEVKIKE